MAKDISLMKAEEQFKLKLVQLSFHDDISNLLLQNGTDYRCSTFKISNALSNIKHITTFLERI